MTRQRAPPTSLGALIRQLFTASDGAQACQPLADAIAQLEPRLPQIARRTGVVGVFPDDSVIRLISMLAIEANDKWLTVSGGPSAHLG